MKLKSTRTITKKIKTYEVHPDIPGVTLVETLENSKRKEVILKGKGPHGSYPMFVKPGFHEFIKKMNPWVGIHGKYGIETFRVYTDEILDGTFEATPENFVWCYHSGHLLFDLNGDPIPVPYCFDYIGTPFTNEDCDLPKMLEHLKKHPWVVNREELKIVDVPYYNNEDGWRQYIVGEKLPWVSVLPDAQSLKEIYLLAVDKDKEYFSSRMKEMVYGGNTYNWPTHKDYKKGRYPVYKDYMELHQFYSPHSRR